MTTHDPLIPCPRCQGEALTCRLCGGAGHKPCFVCHSTAHLAASSDEPGQNVCSSCEGQFSVLAAIDADTDPRLATLDIRCPCGDIPVAYAGPIPLCERCLSSAQHRPARGGRSVARAS